MEALKRWLRNLLLILVAGVILLPLVFVCANSLMGPQEISYYYSDSTKAIAFHLLPDKITLEAFYQILLRQPDYLIKFWNSMLLATIITVSQTFCACLAGFSLSKIRLPFKAVLNYLIILMMLMPLQVTLVANYLVLQKLGLIGNYLAVVLPLLISCFGTFLMKQCFDQVDPALLDAAKVDGANVWKTLWRVVLPNCKSGVGTIAVLGFIDAWNMVEYPFVLLRETEKYPLSVFLAQVQPENLPLSFACGVLALFPPLLVFLFFQEELVAGIEMSNLK